jgi:hypothetical protein
MGTDNRDSCAIPGAGRRAVLSRGREGLHEADEGVVLSAG